MADASLDEETQERAMAGVKWEVRAEVDKVCHVCGGGEGGQGGGPWRETSGTCVQRWTRCV